ncbi:glycoside hydrolase/deacetylase [Anaeromyces robustus]|uniref:Glycoside hydrolase/deacetylase n=1 Tax=Anaeromyces robustus TaxID=1754192 RepID=A0A1Y1W8R2_9FUNG|nr:glycoside hydrolase/deacetylase [Anaeromyces robustus]|eukprot:ORX69832.1 glycoside hydrolase/deacetylase [Anaeromyces robustus]
MVKLNIKLLSILATTTSLIQCTQIHSCKVDGTLALTFDDGPTKYTNELIDTLNKYGVKATFFINAHNYFPYADENPSVQNIIKKAYQSGHQIASHTYGHVIENDIPTMKKSFEKMDKFVKSIIGVTPKYFRAPGNNCDANCANTIENMGYIIVKYDVNSLDWKATTSADPISNLKQAFNQNKKNYLVYMHDSKSHTVQETVPWIINSGMLKNYKFVTVAECLGDKSYGYKEGLSSPSNNPIINNNNNNNPFNSNNNNNSNNNSNINSNINNNGIIATSLPMTATTTNTIAPINTIIPVNNTTNIHPVIESDLATLPYDNSSKANTQQVDIDSSSIKQYNNAIIMIIASLTIFIINLI